MRNVIWANRLMFTTPGRLWRAIVLLVLSFHPSLTLAEKPEMANLKLVPYPRKIEIRKGFLSINKNILLGYDKNSQEVCQVVETFSVGLQDAGFAIVDVGRNEQFSEIELRIGSADNFGAEGYRLSVDKKIIVTAGTADGLFWGTRTLLQLLSGGPGQDIQNLLITDHPEFAYRGLMIDAARNFHTIDFHIDTVKRMASYKLNRYQIHFSDNESYTLPCDSYPSLPTKGRCYTKEQIRQLVDTAKKYHVAIVPEVDVPGHAASLIKGINRLRCDGGSGEKLCLGKEYAYQILEEIYSEIMAMIPGEYWHLGADEVSYRGTTCKDCVAKMKRERFTDPAQLYNYFINRMHDYLKKNGRAVLVWEGFDPTLKPEIHKDIIVCPFDVKHPGRMPINYLDAGYNLLNTSWTPLYVADKIYMTTPEIIARWSPYMFGAGRSPQPFRYWKKINPKNYEGRIIGAQMCSWAIQEKAEQGLLFGLGPGYYEYGRPGPRLQIMAERLWSGSSTSAKGLLERVDASYWDED